MFGCCSEREKIVGVRSVVVRGHPGYIPGFSIFESHVEGKTDTAGCSEIIATGGG